MAHHHWPLFDLRVRTTRLELRLPTDEDLLQVVRLASAGVHDAAEMPFAVPWTDLPGPAFERGILQFHWRCRGTLGPGEWWFDLGAWHGGRLVGMQGLGARDFLVLRTVHTGSWVGRDLQGQGYGKEMRAAALHLAFAGFGAEVATSSAFAGNPASERVSRALGYMEPSARRRGARRRRCADTGSTGPTGSAVPVSPWRWRTSNRACRCSGWARPEGSPSTSKRSSAGEPSASAAQSP